VQLWGGRDFLKNRKSKNEGTERIENNFLGGRFNFVGRKKWEVKKRVLYILEIGKGMQRKTLERTNKKKSGGGLGKKKKKKWLCLEKRD